MGSLLIQDVTATPGVVKLLCPDFVSLNPIWRSVTEGLQRGRVFVDRLDTPSGGLICSTGTGFYFLFGREDAIGAGWQDCQCGGR
jgi:hypothetical protein